MLTRVSLLAHAPAGFFAVAQSADLGRAPLRVWFAGVPLALFRSGLGVAALVDACPHRGVPLSEGWLRHGQIHCPYHGYRYAASGACVHMPGLAAGRAIPKALCTPSLHCVEQQGILWVRASPLAGQTLPPRLPMHDDADVHTAIWPLEVAGGLLDAVENFLDGTHTHYVHRGLIRVPARRTAVHVSVVREGLTAEARYSPARRPRAETSAGLLGRVLTRGIDERIARFVAPAIGQLEYRRSTRTAMVLSALFSPGQAGGLRAWAVVSTRRLPGVPDALVRALIAPLFKLAIAQDRRILRMQAEGRAQLPARQDVLGPLDVMRPHMEHITRHGASARVAQELTLWL
jgi:phenylpropionate dioxygenase-like ring-hydroxylating dioxygenase large terminal subunit